MSFFNRRNTNPAASADAITAEFGGLNAATAAQISEAVGSAIGNRQLIVLSDYDHTLVSRKATPELIDEAGQVDLIIATGRRDKSSALPKFWNTGLLRPGQPAIIENGGAIAYANPTDPTEIVYESLVDDMRPELTRVGQQIFDDFEAMRLDPAKGLTVTLGRTMLLLDLFGQYGIKPEEFAELATMVEPYVMHPDLKVVDTRNSVTIQHRIASKGHGFDAYLQRRGLERKNVFVVGMGDGPNDAEIFSSADVRLGFSPAVENLVDISVPEGSAASAGVLRAIRVGRDRAKS